MNCGYWCCAWTCCQSRFKLTFMRNGSWKRQNPPQNHLIYLVEVEINVPRGRWKTHLLCKLWQREHQTHQTTTSGLRYWILSMFLDSINISHISYFYCKLSTGSLHTEMETRLESVQLFPYDMCVNSMLDLKLQWLLFLRSEVIGQLLQEVKRWLVSGYRKRRVFEQAVRLEVGGDSEGWGRGLDSTTWMRHCSTCLLISSSLPAKGALHSGHTWPPSSGFLLFILPIRAGEGRRGSGETNTERSHV